MGRVAKVASRIASTARAVAANHSPSASACGALFGLLGLIASRAATVPRPALAVLLGGLALAGPRPLRRGVVPLALGLVLGWRQPESMPPFRSDRPVFVVAQRVGDWVERGGLWSCRVRVETVRQGAVVRRWPRTVRWSWPGRSPPAGSRWRLRGWLRQPQTPAHGAAARSPPWSLHVKSERLVERLGDPGWARWATSRGATLRGALRRALATAAPGSAAERLARALVLGEASALPERELRALRRCGVAHLVALSGLHLGVVAAWCALATRPLPPAARVVGMVLGTGLYVVVGGLRPSLLRAWWMVNAGAAVLLSGRPGRSLHALTWAATILAAWRLENLEETGFQLTFAATAGVIVGARLVTRRSATGHPVTMALASTLGAQLATLPVAAPAFHWLPVWSFAWNLAMVPAAALAVPLSLAWALVASVAPAWAASLAPGLGPLAAWLGLPARLPPGFLGGMPWAGLASWGGVALVVAACGVAARHGRRGLWVLAATLIGLALLLGSGPTPDSAVVRFLDVGQGDAALLGDGPSALLIDGGGWKGAGVAESALLPVLGRAGVRRLDVAIVSHGDLDHCRGIVELADYLPIAEVWMAPATVHSDCGRALARRPRVRLVPLWRGARPRWRDWSFHVLGPRPGSRAGGNDDSLVLRAESRGRSVLFTGDVGHRTEFHLVGRTAAELDVTLLKVAHHGSGGSSSASFLRAVSPRLAVVSAGSGNPFGHPAPVALRRLGAAGAAVLRTDRDGLVEVRWRASRGWRIETPGAPKDGLQ